MLSKTTVSQFGSARHEATIDCISGTSERAATSGEELSRRAHIGLGRSSARMRSTPSKSRRRESPGLRARPTTVRLVPARATDSIRPAEYRNWPFVGGSGSHKVSQRKAMNVWAMGVGYDASLRAL